MKKKLLHPISMLIVGFALGVISRLLDNYTQNLGNVFSQMAIWILFGVLISIYSSSPKKAMLNILPFCLGMLLTYYFVAFITDGVYSNVTIWGWSIFAFFSPIFAFFTWFTKEKGLFPKFISIGIISVSLLTSIVFFDRLRFYDFIITLALLYFLFLKKVER